MALTADLIRIPSMHSRPGEIRRCADFILDWCAKQSIAARTIVHDGIPSILIMPAGPTRLLLMSHMDVVDAPAAKEDPAAHAEPAKAAEADKTAHAAEPASGGFGFMSFIAFVLLLVGAVIVLDKKVLNPEQK